jgi:hypothetical protein
VNFLFGKSDYKVNARNQLSARYFPLQEFLAVDIGGGLTTTDSRDRLHRSHGLGVGASWCRRWAPTS